jgi:hypothetical protein
MKIIIQIILIITVVGTVMYFLSHNNSKTAAYKKLLGLFFVVFAAIAIIWPDTTNELAHLLGVQRGADLLLYTLVIVVMFYILSSNLHRRDDRQRIAKLAREVTLLQAKLDNQKSQQHDKKTTK